MPFDGKCLELAKYFLAGEEVEAPDEMELAQAIQDAIEDWMDNAWPGA